MATSIGSTASDELPDPRPVVVERPAPVDEAGEWVVRGWRCTGCAHGTAAAAAVCPRCGEPLEPADLGSLGSVFSWTEVHLGAGDGRPVPYRLAYVDLDGGGRVLAVSDGRPEVGARVAVAGVDERGDLLVAPVEPAVGA